MDDRPKTVPTDLTIRVDRLFKRAFCATCFESMSPGGHRCFHALNDSLMKRIRERVETETPFFLDPWCPRK